MVKWWFNPWIKAPLRTSMKISSWVSSASRSRLSYEDIKHLSHKYNLSIPQVYVLQTEYSSLCTLSNTPEVSLDIFMSNCQYLRDKHTDMIKLLARGMGVDTFIDPPIVSRSQYFKLYVLCTQGWAKSKEMKSLWTAILDPDQTGIIWKKKALCTLEKLARGRYNKKPTIVSATYAM